MSFALAIGLIACQQGFAASGGAEGVGATNAVWDTPSNVLPTGP